MRLTSDDIIGLAFDATSAAELRQELLKRLTAVFGVVGGMMASPVKPTAPCDVIGFSVDDVERTRLPFWTQGSDRESGRQLLLRAVKQRRALADHRPDGPGPSSIIRKYLYSLGVRSVLATGFSIGPDDVVFVCLGRERPNGFDAEAERYLTSLIPALAVASAAVRAVDKSVAISFPRGLTDRQQEICLYVVHGYTNAEIAKACGISLHTVRNHLVKLFRDFGVETRTELATRLLFLSDHRAAGTSQRRPNGKRITIAR